MALGTLLQIASAIVALTGVAAWSVTKESLNQVRAQNGDLRAEVGDKDRRHTEDQATIARQASDIDVLRRVVTGEVQLLAIKEMLSLHHDESMAALRELLGRRTHE